MSILVAYSIDKKGRGGLDLGRTIAESAQEPLVITCAIASRWETVGLGRAVDRDYHEYLNTLAREALMDAQARVGSASVPVSFDVVEGKSVPRALLAAAAERDASALVAGSGQAGAWGRIALGSVTDHLVHEAPLPVVLAPRGHRWPAGSRLQRLTVALRGDEESLKVLDQALALARRWRAPLRVLVLGVRRQTMWPPVGGLHAEDEILAARRRDMQDFLDEVQVRYPGDGIEGVMGVGRGWTEALEDVDWNPVEVLTLGSSNDTPVARVFLGSTATRIVRVAPVPVVLLP